MGERIGLELDADRRQRAAADGDVADAGDLRDLLRQHGGREIVELAGGARLEVSARIMIGACDGLIFR